MADTEREAFELYMSNLGEATNYVGDGMYQSPRMNRRFDDFNAGFVAGRSLASRPAEVCDEAEHALRLLKEWRLKVQEQGYGSVESAIDDAIAAKDRGYKLVPIEPTKEMIWACKERLVPRIALPFFVAAYKTMIEAAPSHTTNKEK